MTESEDINTSEYSERFKTRLAVKVNQIRSFPFERCIARFQDACEELANWISAAAPGREWTDVIPLVAEISFLAERLGFADTCIRRVQFDGADGWCRHCYRVGNPYGGTVVDAMVAMTELGYLGGDEQPSGFQGVREIPMDAELKKEVLVRLSRWRTAASNADRASFQPDLPHPGDQTIAPWMVAQITEVMHAHELPTLASLEKQVSSAKVEPKEKQLGSDTAKADSGHKFAEESKPSADPEHESQQTTAGPENYQRRGRMKKAASEAKRASMLAILREHPSLKDDPAKLAKEVGVSKSTVRRWLDDEERKYRESKAANPDPDEE